MPIFLPEDVGGIERLLRMAVTTPEFIMWHVPCKDMKVSRCMVPKFKFSFEFDAVDALSRRGAQGAFRPNG